MKTTAHAQNQMMKQNESTESNESSDIEDEEPFELNIDLSKFPSKESDRRIRSLVESLQELYQDDLIEIASEVVNQLVDNNVLTENKDKKQDKEIIHTLLANLDWYSCSWFKIHSAEGLIQFLSGNNRYNSCEEVMIKKDVLQEIMNILENDDYYQG